MSWSGTFERSSRVAVLHRSDAGWWSSLPDGNTPVAAPPVDDEPAFERYIAALNAAGEPFEAAIVLEPDAACERRPRLLAAVPAVHALPLHVVLSEIAGPATPRFLHVEFGRAISARLFVRTGGDGLALGAAPQRFAGDGAGLDAFRSFVDSTRALGYERIVCTSECAGGVRAAGAAFSRLAALGNAVWADDVVVRAAARALVRRGLPGMGVTLDGNSTAGLRMTAERSYSFLVEHASESIFAPQNGMLERALGARECVIFVDANVDALYGSELRRYASEHLRCLEIVRVDATERTKTLDALGDVCRAAARSGIRRDGVFVACGGGVLLDLIGAAASTYRRGTSYFRIPTTLVGMIDVCVGIKQGVNFCGKKNFLGSFFAPLGGINDSRFLATLSPSAISAGLAEIVKVAVLLDPGLFELLERFGAELLESKLQAPSQVAREVLLRAEFAMMRELHPNLWENELARRVDFGHTFSPFIETESNFGVTHGHAVALDMLVSTALAVETSMCAPALLERLVALCERSGLPSWHELLSERLLEGLAPMRLHRAGALNLVVPAGLGRAAFVQDVEPDALRAALVRLASARGAVAV